MCVCVCVYIIINNVTSLYFNISLYYQTVNFLNTKNNFILVLVLITILLINVKVKFQYTYISLISLWLAIYLYNSLFNNVNINLYSLLGCFNNVNINLLNGIMLIHPPILYLFYSYFFIHIFNKWFYVNQRLKYLKSLKQHKLFIFMFLVLVSILLGCWWAEQELSWGGWWSWDFVELLALNLFIISIIYIHKEKDTNTNISYIIHLYVLIISVISVRFNIINSIHNFINFESQNQYYIYIIIYIMVYMYWINIYINKNNLNFVTCCFYMFLYVFICFYMFDLFIINLVKLNYNLIFTIKNILNLLIFNFIIYMCIINYKHKHNLLIWVFPILITINLKLAGIFLIYTLYLFFYKINYFKTRTTWFIHLSLCFYFYLCLHQLYLFNVPKDSIQIISLNTIKISTFNVMFSSGFLDIFGVDLLKNILIVDSFKTNNVLYSVNFFNMIFEKLIKVCNLNLFIYELYNYNFQSLIQPIGGLIFFLLTTLLVLYKYINVNKNPTYVW